MSRRKGARNRARANRLAALRAELVLVMEDKLQPHHLAYNHEQTARLIEQFQWRKEIPLWAQKYVRLGRIKRGIADDTMFHGPGIVRLTPDQQSGTIMDMDSGNASGHST